MFDFPKEETHEPDALRKILLLWTVVQSLVKDSGQLRESLLSTMTNVNDRCHHQVTTHVSKSHVKSQQLLSTTIVNDHYQRLISFSFAPAPRRALAATGHCKRTAHHARGETKAVPKPRLTHQMVLRAPRAQSRSSLPETPPTNPHGKATKDSPQTTRVHANHNGTTQREEPPDRPRPCRQRAWSSHKRRDENSPPPRPTQKQ